ncbi:hypothetical protein AZA_88828 [Nitrospirillum viridazoti Y2]|nr:hypothetical protein AZA_88828 [Nitrospirillum amazonense Y2]
MRAHRNAHAGQGLLPVAFRAVGDLARHVVAAGKVVGIEGVGLLAHGVDLIDRHPLLLPHLLEQMAPVGRQVGTVAGAGRHLQVMDLQHVARLGALDINGAGHDVDARVAVGLGDFLEDAGHRLVHHQVRRVAGVVGDGLRLDDVAALDRQGRRLVGGEIAPMHSARRGRQQVQRRPDLVPFRRSGAIQLNGHGSPWFKRRGGPAGGALMGKTLGPPDAAILPARAWPLSPARRRRPMVPPGQAFMR